MFFKSLVQSVPLWRKWSLFVLWVIGSTLKVDVSVGKFQSIFLSGNGYTRMQDMIRRVLHRNTITSQDQCVRIQKKFIIELISSRNDG